MNMIAKEKTHCLNRGLKAEEIKSPYMSRENATALDLRR